MNAGIPPQKKRHAHSFFKWTVLLLLLFLAFKGYGSGDKAKAPVIDGFSPFGGLPGSVVTISGKQFSANPAENVVSYNGVRAKVLSATVNNIVVQVPALATSGPISITTPEGTSSAPAEFTVPFLRDGSVQGFPLSLRGRVTTLAGSAGSAGSDDGRGRSTRFNQPGAVAADLSHIYIADTANHAIRRMDLATGEVATVAGTPGTPGFKDGAGSEALLDRPAGLTTDGSVIYLTDASNTIRRVDLATGMVSTIAGRPGAAGTRDGPGSAARFDGPAGIARVGNNLYIADFNNNTIRKLSLASGQVSTIAGSARVAGSANGVGAAARFKGPFGLATDGSFLYISDFHNSAIRRLRLSDHAVSTLSGVSGISGTLDGFGQGALFSGPTGLSTDGFSLYISDRAAHTIRQLLLANAQVTTIASLPLAQGSNDGTGSAARFFSPSDVVCIGAGVIVADSGNHTIRLIQ